MPENEKAVPSAREKAGYLILGISSALLAVISVFSLISGAMALNEQTVSNVYGSAAPRPILLLGSTAIAWLSAAGLFPAVRYITAYTRRYLIGALPAKKQTRFRPWNSLPRETRAALNREYRGESKTPFLIAAAAFALGIGGLAPALFGAAYHPAFAVLYVGGFGAAELILLYVSRGKVFWLENKEIF